jgi:pyruvate/2-oxoglutarate dehydrogenase complex dihydrolipoamide dehydrogenase (E3) component
MHTYDVIVLGGGSAGTSAAAAAHRAGAKVAMFNKGELGGLCILMGCMPTKTMLHAAHLVHEAGHHETPGVGRTEPTIGFAEVMANKDAKVARFKNAKLRGIEKAGYEVIDAYARFQGEDTVVADNGESYRFTKGAVIATGSDPVIPPIAGIEEVPVWTSDDVLNLREIPESVIVLGSGAIGLELALFLARMGTKVIQASRSKILAKIDPILNEEMERVIADEPDLELVSPFRARSIAKDGDGVRFVVDTDDGERVMHAKYLVAATGRQARLDDLGLEDAGVKFEGGRVEHDDAMRTTNPRIFVAGDATGSLQLLHVANWEGRAAGLGAAEVAGDHAVERRLDMSVIFTDPPLATIGMTEAAARAAGLPVAVAVEHFNGTGRAITMDVQHGVWKLVANAETGEILGSQILGPRADDIVHVLSTAMYYRGTVHDLMKMPWYHPTLTEVLLSLARTLAN